MADSHRIEDLRRRVQKDPSSIAFAQLAEECRRAGEFQQAVDVCRAGLELHPGYLSARVTLGRALAELDQMDAAQGELEVVLKGAPDNLAAIRALAEILHRRGSLGEALARYRTALSLSRNDPELERIINELSREVESAKASGKGDPSTSSGSSRPSTSSGRPEPAEGRAASRGDAMNFEQAARELSKHAPPATLREPQGRPEPARGTTGAEIPSPAAVRADEPTTAAQMRTLAALEQWLTAIHVARAARHA